MSKSQNSSEGTIIAVSLVIIVVCMAGSMATNTSPVAFFVFGVFSLISIAIVIAFLALVASVLIKTWVELRKEDGRTLIDILKQDYAPSRVLKDYAVLGRHARGYVHEIWESFRSRKN